MPHSSDAAIARPLPGRPRHPGVMAIPRLIPLPRGATRRLASALLAISAATSWSWPVAAPHPIARSYLAPAAPWAAGHRGIDIAAATGTEVRAPADGIVHFAGWVVDRPVLSIDHGDGVISSYEPVRSELQAGDRVQLSEVIGVLEPGHCARGGCLHLGVRVHGEYVSPLRFLGGVPRAVLLPP